MSPPTIQNELFNSTVFRQQRNVQQIQMGVQLQRYVGWHYLWIQRRQTSMSIVHAQSNVMSTKEPTVPCNPPFESVSFAEKTKLIEGNPGSLGPSSSQNSFSTVGFFVCSAKDTVKKGGSLREP